MCGYRSSRRERYLSRPWNESSDNGPVAADGDNRPATESEREDILAELRRHAAADRMSVKEFVRRSDAAFAATSRAELFVALDGLPEATHRRREAAPRRRHARPFPLLPVFVAVVVVALVAGHGWFLFPLAWLLLGVLRPWGRRHRSEPPTTRW